MLSKRVLLSFLMVAIMQKTIIPSIVNLMSTTGNKTNVAWSQVCSCRSYHGVPHTCYYSPVSDPDYSCISKCVREANQ